MSHSVFDVVASLYFWDRKINLNHNKHVKLYLICERLCQSHIRQIPISSGGCLMVCASPVKTVWLQDAQIQIALLCANFKLSIASNSTHQVCEFR